MMKKCVLLFLLAALSFSLSAQEIIGKWNLTANDSSNGVEVTSTNTLVFEDDAIFSEGVLMDIKITANKKEVSTKVKISCNGTWSLRNDILEQQYDADSIQTEVIEKTDGMPDSFQQMFTKALISTFKKHSKKPVQYKVLSLTESVLTIQEVGNKESETYSRSN